MAPGRLAGKVAIVSGSGRGIGRAVAIRLAAEGAALAVNDLDATFAEETVAQIRERGGRALACVGDVTEPVFGERFVQSAMTGFGGLDIIVNNAGYTRDGVIQKQSDEQFQAMLDVHLLGPFRILRAAASPLRETAKREAAEGREVIRKVVNISSMAGTHGNAGQVNYASAKAGLIGMTKTLAKEWGPSKVCVNCVSFGFIETRLTAPRQTSNMINVGGELVQAGVPAETLAALRAKVPLGRAGSVDEAAGAVYFFCSPDSDYVSGETVTVSGGLSF